MTLADRIAIDRRDGPGTAERRDAQATRELALYNAERELLATLEATEIGGFLPAQRGVGVRINLGSETQAQDFVRAHTLWSTLAKRRK